MYGAALAVSAKRANDDGRDHLMHSLPREPLKTQRDRVDKNGKPRAFLWVCFVKFMPRTD
jgi:hypothetical protein